METGTHESGVLPTKSNFSLITGAGWPNDKVSASDDAGDEWSDSGKRMELTGVQVSPTYFSCCCNRGIQCILWPVRRWYNCTDDSIPST